MNLARLIDALRARPAVLVAAVLILLCLLGFVGALRPRHDASSTVLFTNTAPATVTTLAHEPVPVVTFVTKPPPPPAALIMLKTNRPLTALNLHAELPRETNSAPPSPPPAPVALVKTNRPLAALNLHAELPPDTNAVPMSAPMPAVVLKTNRPLAALNLHANLPPETNLPPLGAYAPAGRLLRCQLVNAVDSALIDTPIIALVTDDLWHDGQLIVPAGTEVHSRVRVDRLRERLVASGTWTLVWQSGQELTVHGIALDRGESANGQTWELTDGSAGLRGEVLRSDSMDEVKLFAATFLSGMASGLQQTRETVFGTQVANNIRNAALSGTSQVLNAYAQQILETIKRDGLYVRVPAGKQMYLYLTDTLDLSQARIGRLRAASQPAPVSFPNLNTNNKP